MAEAAAKNIYVSAAGNDNNTGLSVNAPWKTLAKLNAAMSMISAGDSVLFRCGDSFYGSLIITTSGTKGAAIVFGSYGTGSKPVISGFTAVSIWTLVSPGIYKTSVNAKVNLNLVTINDIPQQVGRYPNATDANGGYLTYENFKGNTAIVDSLLTGTTDWTGAEVAIRKSNYLLDRCKVTSHAGNTITYNINNPFSGTAVSSRGTKNFGYFFMNDIRTLDQAGEWYFNPATKELNVFFGSKPPGSYATKVATVDTLVNTASSSYLSFINLSFQGANMSAIYNNNGNGITVYNCTMQFMGAKAVQFLNTGSVSISYCSIDYCMSNGIQSRNTSASNPKTDVYIGHNSITNTAVYAGMGSNGSDYTDNKALVASAFSNILIEYNKIDNVGYTGIDFQGNNVVVQENEVSNFCKNMDDGAGIYTYVSYTITGGVGNPNTNYTNRVVKNNIVHDGIGASRGTTGKPAAQGGYSDGMSMNINYINNTFYNLPAKGLTHNNPYKIVDRGNIFYNCKTGINITRWDWGRVGYDTIKGNVFFSLSDAQETIHYVNAGLNNPAPATIPEALALIGVIDSNYYSMYNKVPFTLEVYATKGGPSIKTSPMSLSHWTAYSGYDAHSKITKEYPAYTIGNHLTNNLAAGGGTFTNDIAGYTGFGAATAFSWDNTSQITGTGSLKYVFSEPVLGTYPFVHSAIGAITNGSYYLVRLKTRAAAFVSAKVYIRKTGSPYNIITNTAVVAIGTAVAQHEVLLQATGTEAAGSIVIGVEQGSGTTYVDDVEVYKVNAAPANLQSSTQFIISSTTATVISRLTNVQ